GGGGLLPRGGRVAPRVPRGGAHVHRDRARPPRCPARRERGRRRDHQGGRAGGSPMRPFWLLLLPLFALPACGRHDADAPAAAAERSLTPAQLSFLKFAPVAEVEATDVADLPGTVEFDEERTARLNAPVAGRVSELLVR